MNAFEDKGLAMSKLGRIFLHGIVVLATLGAAREAIAGEDDPGADAAVALSMRAAHRMKQHECESLAGSAGWQLQWAEYFWESKYVVAFDEAEVFMDALPKEQRSSMDRRIEDLTARLESERAASGGPDAACLGFVGWTKLGFPQTDLLDSGVADRLQIEYANRSGGAEAVRRAEGRKDWRNGCMKQAYNKLAKPADFGAVHTLCVCIDDAVASSSTQAEIDANDQFAAEHGKVDSVVVNRLREQPGIQAAAPKMAACMKAQPELMQQLQGSK